MGKKTTFIHAADLHLGAPFRGLRSISPVWADRLMRSIPTVYNRLIDRVLNEEVDFLVFSGDVFDNARPSYANFCLFVDGMKQLEAAGIPVYIVAGNHDPYNSWMHDLAKLPSSVHMFKPNKPTFELFEKDGEPLVTIGGRSYYNQSWPVSESIADGISREAAKKKLGVTTPFMVGVIHTGLNIDPTRSPVNPSQLMQTGVNYWACGHIHKAMLFPPQAPLIAFSGCPQGRDIKETGEHGILKVTLEENAPNKVTFIPTAQVEWQQFTIDVTDCATIAEIQEQITNEEFTLNAKTQCQNMISRVELVGKTPLHYSLTAQVINDVRDALNSSFPFFFVDSLINHTQPPINKQTLKKEGLFPAVYLKTLKTQGKNQPETVAYLEKQFFAKDLSLPHSVEADLPDMYRDAETLVLDLLGKGDA